MSISAPALFNQTKPAIIRLWHWLAVIFFAASVTTVILNATLFKTKKNINMVQEMVKEKGGIITPEQAKNVAHQYSDKLWNVHKYIGFGLAFLMLWRIIAEAIIAKDKRMYVRMKIANTLPDTTYDKGHYMMVQYSYLTFYVLFLIMASTGLVLAFEDVEFLKPIHKLAKDIHNLTQWGLYGFMTFHIAGVLLAELGDQNGIVSAMINGKKTADKQQV